MKTYLPQIERRIFVRPNPVYGIINYDCDNAYPQRVLELVRQSPTASKCWKERTKYLNGNGFKKPGLGETIINDKGLTLAKLLKQICKDKAIYPGYGLHVNYNANYKISSVSLVKYEDIRQGDTDTEVYKGKYVIYKDWGKKTWRPIYTAKFQVLNPFNPDPVVIEKQVIAAGGWDKYKGQIFYLTPVVDDYELCDFDASLEDIETESGIKVFNNREVKTGFLPSTMLFMPTRREEADNIDPKGEENQPLNTYVPSKLEQDLADFQGAEKSQKIIVIEYDGEENKPEFKPYSIQNNDKLFESTETSVEGRIIKAWSVPKELVQTQNKQGLNASGAEKRQAIQELNDNTSEERNEISRTLETIFSNFYININPSNDWSILEVTTEGAGETVIKYADKVQAIIESPRMTYDNKVICLVEIYGFDQEVAKKMVPTDEFIKEASATNPAPVTTKTNDSEEQK